MYLRQSSRPTCERFEHTVALKYDLNHWCDPEKILSSGRNWLWLIQCFRVSLVCSVSSNWTGCYVFCGSSMALGAIPLPWQTPPPLSLTRSQLRNLLPIARLYSANSLVSFFSCRLIRIAHISRCFNGGFWATSLSLFQGVDPFSLWGPYVRIMLLLCG